MTARFLESKVSPEDIRLILLRFGLSHAYRVLGLDEIAQSIGYLRKEALREGLERLANEGLVTRFSGRYCFNKAIPPELRCSVESSVTPSGTMRAVSPSRLLKKSATLLK